MFWLACASPPEATDPLTYEALYASMEAMTGVGPRLVGTPGEARAAAWITRELESMGLQVDRHAFSWEAWTPGEATITVGDDTWEAWALSPAPGGEVTGSFLAEDFSGEIALLSSEDGARAEAFFTALTGGAQALVRVTEDVDADGTALAEVGHILDGISMPSVAVSSEVGAALEGQTGTVTVTASLGELTSYNLAATLPGSGTDEVMLVAHYDSWHPSESAFDNALGVAFLLQLAKRLQQTGSDATVHLLFTTGEEQGLKGAQAWVDERGADLDRLLNVDIPWSSDGTFFVAADDEATRARALELADEHGLDPVDAGLPNASSDHFVFQTQGVDTSWHTRWPDRRYHTVNDTLALLDMEGAVDSLAFHWDVLAELAGVP